LPADETAALLLLGDTRVELSGSEWAWVMHDHLGGRPPTVDLAVEKRLAGLLAEASARGVLAAAHDLSDGGLAQALVEACLRTDVGATVTVPDDDPCGFLFSESAGRALVALPRDQLAAFASLCREHGVPVAEVGAVAPGSGALEVAGQFSVPLDQLREAYEGTLPALFG
jgi:phosphoribosylformylglycinamidine synthase